MDILLLTVAGAFTVSLGCLHFAFPYLLDFRTAIPRVGPGLKEFALGPVRHPTSRDDVWHVVWLMNFHVSFTLVTIGTVDIFASWWVTNALAPWVLGWIGAWWLIRAGCQLKFESSWKSSCLTALFVGLGALHWLIASRVGG